MFGKKDLIKIMEILILADSRAMWPREYSWPNVLQQMLGKGYNITSYISGIDKWLASINMMEEFLLDKFPDKVFDIIIIQAGWHEGGPCFWPEETWKEIINTKTREFNQSSLIDKIENNGKSKFLYKDEKEEKSVFKTFRSRGRNVIFINMHSVRPPNDLNKEYGLGMTHQYKQLEANFRFSPVDCDSFSLPQDNEWISNCCLPDRLHYMFHGINYIATYLARYIQRAHKILPNLLADSSKHKSLFEESKRIGSFIANNTQERDKVILCDDLTSNLIAAFWGCILYNRIPLIIQHPSVKVHSSEFHKKLQRIKEIVNPSFCFCSEKYFSSLKTFFNAAFTINNPHNDRYELDLIDYSSDDVAFLQLSSGTTGDVKILEVTHKQAIENVEEYALISNINQYSSIVSWLPLYHDMGLITSVIIPVVMDCSVAYIDTFLWLSRPVLILEMIEKYKATHVWWPNFVFSFLANQKDDISKIDLSSLQFLISCSELSFNKDINKFIEKYKNNKLNCQIANCYALAENVFAVSQSNSLSSITLANGFSLTSCGRAMQGISVLILNDNEEDITGEPVVGKIYIKSNTITTKTLNKYGYYDTGDLGLIYNGEIFVAGRNKDNFVSFGINIYPELVEKSLDGIKGITPGRIACIGIQDNELGTCRTFIIAETNDLSLADVISKEISLTVKNLYEVSPTVFIENPSFLIKTSSGKISRFRSGEKLIKKIGILNIINKFLAEKNKPSIRISDRLYTSGLLDSLELFELILFLEKSGVSLNKELLTKDSFRIDLDKIDNIDGIIAVLPI